VAETGAGDTAAANNPRAYSSDARLLVVAAYAASFVVFGLAVSGPVETWRGLVAIWLSRDTLLTDYIGLGGIGGAFVNAGALTLAACAIYRLARAEIGGAPIAALFLVLGFALFGKNLLNVWFILLGVSLYARFKGEPFASHINVAFFGCALAPIFSEILFSTALPATVTLPLAVVTSLGLGFVLSPVAAQLFKAHMGYNLYNMGFTAGIVGTLVVAMYKAFGFVPEPKMIWTSGNNVLLGTFLAVLLVSMCALGLLLDRSALRNVRNVLSQTGQSPSDFVASAGLGAALLNMGVCGLVGLAYILAVGGDLNGPVIGALFTIVGFAAYGKHPLNIAPVMLGVFLASLIMPAHAAQPGVLLAALFGTTLAPIAGAFGWHWGVVAGLVHAPAALAVGVVHGGLNLYNNGFAAGLVASVLAPVIIAIRSRAARKDTPEREIL
jgi:hypothetical protein